MFEIFVPYISGQTDLRKNVRKENSKFF